MKTPRKQKKTTGKPARGLSHASTDAAATSSTFVGSLLSLESRFMFDGAAVATVSTVTTEQFALSQADTSLSDHDAASADTAPAPTGEPQPTNGDQSLFDALAAYDSATVRQEILFVSASVLEYQQLLDGISPNVEVHVLDPARDGVEQMAEILAGRSGIDAVHLIGEGTEAEMHLGASFLTQDSISARYAEQFQQIGRSLSADADLLIYGCNFGRGEAGQAAIQTLATLTGADVAASTDRTGHVSEFGDWQLEVSTGMVESSVVIGETTQSTWEGVLATYTVTNINDSGVNSLRQAIINANANAGSDTINFNIAGAGLHTINLTSALPTITGGVTINGYTETGSSVNTLATGNNAVLLIELNGTGTAGANGLVLGAGSAGSTIRGLIINRFDLSGIQVDSTNNLIVGNWIGVNSTGTLDRGNLVDGITISANNNTIGTLAAADRNVLSGNDDEGVDVDPGVTGIVIQGNYIGTNAMGTAAVPDGLASDPDSGGARLEGGGTVFQGNLVSGNLNWGVYVNGTGNVLYGNQIGTNAAGTTGIANSGAGIRIIGGSNHSIGGTAVGQGNTIAFNTDDGIRLESATSAGNAILGNSIFSNTGLGIDLTNDGVTANDAGDGDAGANNLMNFPVIYGVFITGGNVTITGEARSGSTVEFFESPDAAGGNGEGQTFIGRGTVSGTTPGTNDPTAVQFSFTFAVGTLVISDRVTATATDPTNNTSEFGLNVAAVANSAPVLDNTMSPALTASNEDAGAPVGAVGTLVSALVDFAAPAGQVDNVTDANAGALLGIAIRGANATNGTWFYSTDNGSNWNAVGAVANNNALLLAADASTRLYFQPNANFNGAIANAITFRAWDQTSGSNGTKVSTAANGGTTAFSTAFDTASLVVTAVNDAPTATNLSAAETYTEDTARNLINIVVSDVDSANVTATLTLSDVAAGSLSTGTSGAVTSTFVGGVWTASGARANVNTLLAGVTFTPALDYNSNFTIATSVSDGVAPAITGVKAMTGLVVNDAPVLDLNAGAAGNNVTTAFTEQTPVLIAPVGTLSDVDSATLSSLTVTLTARPDGDAVESLSLNAAATTTASGAGLTVSYTPATGVLSITGSATTAVYQSILQGIQYNDTSDTPTTSNRSITVVANDGVTPSVTRTVTLTVAAVNDAPVVDLNAGGAGNNVTTAFTEQTPVLIAPVGTLSDVDSANMNRLRVTLTARPDGNAVESLSLNAAATAAASGAGLTVTYTSASGLLQITGAATTAVYQSILQGILYNNTSDTPTTSNRSITVVARDSTNVSSTSRTATITVTAVNDAPTATNLSAAESYTEDTALNLIDIVASDVDSANITATLTLSDVAAGSLNTATSGAVTSTFVGGVWTASGAIADVNTLLAGVTFTPALDYNSNFTIATSVSDGVAPALTGVKAMTGTAVNDAPVNTVPGAQVINEDTALALGGVSVNDVDGNLSTVQLGVTQGTVTVSLAGGATITAGANGTATLTLSGTQAQINAALASLLYQGTLDYNGPDTLTVTSTDTNLVTDVDTVAITVSPVNDAPSLATNAGATVVQGLTDPITSGELQVTDADNTPGQLTYTVTTAPLNGQLELTTAPGVAITSFTQADINAGRLVFVHSGAVSTSDSFIFTVSDGVGGTIGATTFTFTVTPFVPPPPPPPPPPGPGPVPVPVPVPGPPGLPPVGVVTPVLQPPPVLVTVVGAIDERVRREAMPRRTFARVEQPDIVLQEPLALSLEPLSLPVKKMLDMGHKLAERLTRLADDLDRVMQERENQTRLFGRVTTLSGMALSAGFVAWILRGGSLLASFLVSMPAWRHFDPLPVLGLGGQDRRKRDRKAREEQARETKEFRGLDRVLKSSAKPAKRQETGRVRRPKS